LDDNNSILIKGDYHSSNQLQTTISANNLKKDSLVPSLFGSICCPDKNIFELIFLLYHSTCASNLHSITNKEDMNLKIKSQINFKGIKRNTPLMMLVFIHIIKEQLL